MLIYTFFIFQQLNKFKAELPNYADYLRIIFATPGTKSVVPIRQLASIELCRLLEDSTYPLSQKTREEIYRTALQALEDDQSLVQNGASKILSSTFHSVGFSNSLPLLKQLLSVLKEHGSSRAAIGAGKCLEIITEDYKQSFADQTLKPYGHFLLYFPFYLRFPFPPRFLQFIARIL